MFLNIFVKICLGNPVFNFLRFSPPKKPTRNALEAMEFPDNESAFKVTTKAKRCFIELNKKTSENYTTRHIPDIFQNSWLISSKLFHRPLRISHTQFRNSNETTIASNFWSKIWSNKLKILSFLIEFKSKSKSKILDFRF